MSALEQVDDLLRGRSEQLRNFVLEAPLERSSIFAFVDRQARVLKAGARVLDVGAGDAPYRELFVGQEYLTLDHDDTEHAGNVDLHGSADSIPAGAGEFDVVVCTQVLEHVPEPLTALREFHRVLVPGGLLLATVPFVWEEHELPHDYFRYTRPGIEHLLRRAEYAEWEVQPRTDCFTTLAQLAHNCAWIAGSAPDGLDPARRRAREALEQLSESLVALAPLDIDKRLPLGYTVRAVAGMP
ncbi:MAG TPA: methyltransferase domain-containing protein [Solirubrobacteraceae bacterium]